MAKIMVSIRDESFRLLGLEAMDRGITVQELIRAVIVPDWFRDRVIPRVPQRCTHLEKDLLFGKRTEVPLVSPPRPNERT